MSTGHHCPVHIHSCHIGQNNVSHDTGQCILDGSAPMLNVVAVMNGQTISDHAHMIIK